MVTAFALLFVAIGLFNFACSVLILRELNRAGITGGNFETRWHLRKHLGTYRELREKKSGRTPWAYWGYRISFPAMILCALLALFLLPAEGIGP